MFRPVSIPFKNAIYESYDMIEVTSYLKKMFDGALTIRFGFTTISYELLITQFKAAMNGFGWLNGMCAIWRRFN